jgi:ribosomal protein S12 methylthiotransferase accessory factor
MHEVLRFRPDLRVLVAGDDDMVFLVGEHERFLLQGRPYVRVAAQIDGRRSLAEIFDALGDTLSLPEADYVVAVLRKQGLLLASPPALAPAAAAYWRALGLDDALVDPRLRAAPVAVTAVGGADPAPLVASLAGAGVGVDPHAALRLVVTTDYLDPALAAAGAAARAAGFAWLPVRPGGTRPWIGPLFRPGAGPCWECLAQRLRVNHPVESFLAERLGRPVGAPAGALPASERAALELAALTVARWIADGGRGAIDDHLLALDLGAMRLDQHRVVRRPQCPACGDPGLLRARAGRPLRLEPGPARSVDDGGYRRVTPEETYARLEHLISPITGVVTAVRPVAGRDHPLRPVYGAAFMVRPAAGRTPELRELCRATLGKGRTPAQARTSALCEAVERYSAAVQGDEPLRRATLAELGPAAVHPHDLLRYSDAQYRRRDEWNRGIHDRRQRVPEPFDAATAIAWAPAWSLTADARRWLPAACCYLDLPAPAGEWTCALDPNGHAAGNDLAEAVLQGFLELAERDAVGIWWYGRIARPRVDLADFGDPYFTALEDHYRAQGYALWVLDVTTDLEIPAFVALARSSAADRWLVGFGCHLEARIGVSRALTELNQLFDPAGAARAPWGPAPLADESFLSPGPGAPRRAGDFEPYRSRDLRGDVEACIGRAARLGLETIVLDQTRPDLGLHAVKVVVPGLRHFWPRLGPGRLYDVPVRMGWLARARAEDELNQTPLYL